MTRAQARADVMRMLDGTGVSRSVHTMQQQPGREDHLEYYARRAEQARAQADARPGEAYCDDLDTWRKTVADHVPLMVRELEGDDVIEALCGHMGRLAA